MTLNVCSKMLSPLPLFSSREHEISHNKMAETEESMSKAAKKNKKRHLAKDVAQDGPTSGETLSLTPKEVMPLLKQQLEEAKINKDHAKAGKLRDQIWVLTDVIAGVKTNIPQDEMKEIVESLPIHLHSVVIGTSGGHNKPKTAPKTTTQQASSADAESSNDAKKLAKLKKKLDQIISLKERQRDGEELEANQIKKVESEGKVREEIEDLEEALEEMNI